MKLTINNRTKYLNNYFFQMLCLLYYPGEKFPAEGGTGASASFEIRGEAEFFCTCTIVDGAKAATHTAHVIPEELLGDSTKEYAAEICAGRAMLACGSELFGFVPPWGLMVGLRPVKRALYYLDLGRTREQVKEMFIRDFSVSGEKSEFCVDIAERQQKVLKRLSTNDYALYVAIPFCPSRCSYCSFVSYSGQKLFSLLGDYLVRLYSDIKKTADMLSQTSLKLSCVYIGGGTPTILSPSQLRTLLETICSCFDMSAVREFTLEGGRPDTITDEKLTVAEAFGVTRFSINTQTTDNNILQAIGRKHTAEEFFEAYKTAASHRLSINTDLIAGLPGDTEEGFRRSLEDMIRCSPDNITVHTMSVKNAAPIRFDFEGVYDAEGEAAKSCVSYAMKRLHEMKYEPYYLYRHKNTVGNAENCGYALEGTEGLYNIITMEERHSVFACGASALTKVVSGDRIERFAFPKYPFEYLKKDDGVFEDKILPLIQK